MKNHFDVVTLDEAMLMLAADETAAPEAVQRFHKHTAGAQTNVAIGLAQPGLRVGWGSRLGTDSMGRYLLAETRREGIGCLHVEVAPGERNGFQFKGRSLYTGRGQATLEAISVALLEEIERVSA